MVPLQTPIGESSFPPGYEHLDANRLLEGYTDRGEYAEWTAGIETSPNDTRQYRLIRLKNGLECMLVHNPAAETCAASMAVRVGHLHDPEKLPGLAHFLEHLLFMGSAKYPGENEYGDCLSKHNGWSNAYTSTDQTVYFFETTHAGFDSALDRFSQFFVSPLFKESCVEKEIKAVDSEHQKNLQSDSWRFQQLRRSLAKPDHPYHKFGTGDLDTLWNKPKAAGLDIRAELIKFYEKHYSANLMKLCITSSEPLDKMLYDVLRLFNEVHNQNALPTIFPEDPYPEALHMTRIAVKQIKDDSFLLIQMPFYDSSKVLGSKPASMIAHLLGNTGQNSLFAFLRKKGLVTSLTAYPFTPAPGIHFFVIACDLTRNGVKQHQLVAATVYQYIKLLKNQPLPSWVFRELQQMRQIRFRFLEAKDSVSQAAVATSVALHSYFPRSHIFSAPYTLTEGDPKAIKLALSYLTREKSQVYVVTPSDIEGVAYKEREKWYGTEYAIDPLKSDWFEGSLGPNEKLSLPDENRFVPQNLELIGSRNTSKPFPRPLLIKQTEGQRIWFKQDDRWKVPKGSFFIKLSNPFMRSSYKNPILCASYLYLVHDALEKYSNDAASAGLGYAINRHQQDLVITVSGFTDKLPQFLKTILHHLKKPKIDQEAFDLMKEDKLKQLENETHDGPLDQVRAEFSWILNSAGATFDQRKDVLNAMKLEDVHDFSKELLSQFYAEALTMYELVSMTEEILDYGRLPRSAIPLQTSRIIPEKSNYVVRMLASSKEEVNNAIRYYTHVGHPNDQDLFVRLMLLRTLIGEPCFNTLRTKEQLGYSVGANATAGPSNCGLVIVIQSARSPVHLECRINAFLEDFAHKLETMDLEKFESAKNGFIANLSEDYKNQWMESETYWSHIEGGDYDFFAEDRLTAMLKPLSLRDIHAFFMNSIDKLVEVLEEHKIDAQPVKDAVKEQPLPKDLRDIVAKHIKESSPDLHKCCETEILNEVTKLDEFPSLERDLPGAKLISSSALKNLLVIGEPRKPIGDFYDGVANL